MGNRAGSRAPPGEALGPSWENVDLDSGMLRVRRSRQRPNRATAAETSPLAGSPASARSASRSPPTPRARLDGELSPARGTAAQAQGGAGQGPRGRAPALARGRLGLHHRQPVRPYTDCQVQHRHAWPVSARDGRHQTDSRQAGWRVHLAQRRRRRDRLRIVRLRVMSVITA